MKNKHEETDSEGRPISALLNAFLKTYGLEQGLQKVQIEEAWAEIMGTPIASYTRKVTFREGVLYVELDSDPLRQELKYGLSMIVRSFQERFGPEVREVRLV